MKLLNFLKFDKWWLYKIGSGIFTLLLFKFLILSKDQTIAFSSDDLVLFIELLILAVIGHLINDISDFKSDTIAGKQNMVTSLGYNMALLILLVLVSFCFCISINLSEINVVLVCIQLVLNVLYSFQPFRVKERGVWAMILTGFYERSLPIAIIIFYILKDSQSLESRYILSVVIVYLIWSYLWECRNYLKGQLMDRSSDLISNSKTIAVLYKTNWIDGLIDRLYTFELITFVGWLLIFIFYDIWNVFVLFGMLVIPFFHQKVQGNTLLFLQFKTTIDYVYIHSLLAAFVSYLLVIQQLTILECLSLILLFRSNYLIPTLKTISIRFYIKVRFVLAFLVNHTIYFFTKNRT
jgi:hypothetical protein